MSVETRSVSEIAYVAFLGEVATALGIDAQNDGWHVIEYARRLRAAAAEEVRAARALGAAVNDGSHEEEMAASTASANALAALEEVLRG